MKHKIGFWRWLWNQKPKFRIGYEDNKDVLQAMAVLGGWFGMNIAIIFSGLLIANVVLGKILYGTPFAIVTLFFANAYFWYRIEQWDDSE